MTVRLEHIRKGVRSLGLSGIPLCVHSSLSSFGWIDGGAPTVIHALQAEGCTVMVPTFSWGFALPPFGEMPRQNGWDSSAPEILGDGLVRTYTPDTTEIDRDTMGTLPATVVTMPGRVRGNHPLSSISAIGPMAHELVDEQGSETLHSPFRSLAGTGGWVVLMGVGLNKMTLLHLAEQMAGRNMFRRWANGPDGKPTTVEASGCSRGFDHFEPVLSPLARGTRVGDSRWVAYPAAKILDAACEAIRDNPRITHCGDARCARCNDAIRGGPILNG